MAAQTTQVMQNLGLALKAAGASYANIVKIVTFVVGYKPELRPIIGQARSAFFEGMTPPASTLVGVSALAAPEWLIEIEAVASSIDFGNRSSTGSGGDRRPERSGGDRWARVLVFPDPAPAMTSSGGAGNPPAAPCSTARRCSGLRVSR